MAVWAGSIPVFVAMSGFRISEIITKFVKMKEQRHIVWFSCGAASAVTAKLAVDAGLNPVVVYCDTMESEHPDNERFFNDVQKWIGTEIIKIHSENYQNIDDVFMKTRYMSGVAGARCTTEMKKIPRLEFQEKGDLFSIADIHHFGFTVDECKRIINFKVNNPEIISRFLLAYHGLTKFDCKKRILNAGIKLPIMYDLGFNNNNCIGCVKAQSPKYWNLTRRHFPDVFKRRCEQSRKLEVRLVKIGKKRIFLDQLKPEDMTDYDEQIECGVVCQK